MTALARQAANLLVQNKAIEVVRLLEGVLETTSDSDAHALLGVAYALTQREDLAYQCYGPAQASEFRERLGQILANFYSCRIQLLKKLGKADPESQQLLGTLKEQPDPILGSTLSACLIVKNEEKNLARCLASVQDICDELVVIDTGSTDRTIEIAETFGAKIGHFPWINDFAAARNASLDLASCHWALWIDADEELTPESIGSIREALVRPQFGGYYIPIANLMDAQNVANEYVHLPVRLFQRIPEIRFEGRIHEQILPSFERHHLVPATLSNAKILHYGYQHEAVAEKNKISRTVTMLQREVAENPADSFQWFNLANAYALDRRFEDCIEAATCSIKNLTPGAPFGPVAFQLLSSSLVSTGQPEEAVRVADEAKRRGFFTVINRFELAHALTRAGRPDEALREFDLIADMEWPPDLPGDKGIQGYKGEGLRGQILADMGRYSEAEESARRALAVDPNYRVGWFVLGQALRGLERPGEAADAFLKASTGAGLKDCRVMAAQELRRAGDLEGARALFQETFTDEPHRVDLGIAWLQVSGEKGDVDQFAADCETGWAQGLRSAEIAVNWGHALVQKGDLPGAATKFAWAIEIDPASANAYFCLGDLLYRLGQLSDAASMYEQGLQRESDNPDGWFVLGNAMAGLGHEPTAARCYQEALRLNPQHEKAANNLEILMSGSQTAA